ncbi:hypothetical protein [Spirosoma koreense]
MNALHPSNSLTSPYRDAGLNKIYSLLFADDLALYKAQTQAEAYPWDVLLADQPDTDRLKAVATDTQLETRHKLLAYHRLRQNGFPIPEKILLGVIIEVGLSDGLDVLAAFSDGSCRYINHTEKLLVWDTQTPQSRQLVDQLFLDSLPIVGRIGPWNKDRTPFPAHGRIRLSFLVSDGFYFGEGPFDALQKDALAGPVINAGIQLMAYLIEQAT